MPLIGGLIIIIGLGSFYYSIIKAHSNKFKDVDWRDTHQGDWDFGKHDD